MGSCSFWWRVEGGGVEGLKFASEVSNAGY